MIFGEIKTESSENAILSSYITIDNKQSKVKIKKGTQIDKDHINLLLQNNINSIVCAQLEKNDVEENLAVHKISQSLVNKKNSNLKISKPHEGRSNIISNLDEGRSTFEALYFCINIPKEICSFAIPMLAAWDPDLLLSFGSIINLISFWKLKQFFLQDLL